MSLLGAIPGGSCLGPVELKRTRCDESYESLRARIYADLLPHQRAFVDDTTTLLLGLCTGFGGGKTHALCAKVLFMAMDNPGKVAAVFEPTHIMLRDVWMRSFDDFLERYSVPHDFRVSPQPEYTLHLPDGPTTLLCRATETWNRIRGQNLAFAAIDEIDTSPQETAQKASEMVLARLRGGNAPQLAVASTPEGYRWMYTTFVERGDAPDRRLIKGRTTDNPHLPPGFVESLYANYPPQLIASYINGEFTNLANTSVYYPFDRDVHWCDTSIRTTATDTDAPDRLYVAVDFNVGACFTYVLVRRANEFHVVAEHHPKDTPALAALLTTTYPDFIERGDLVVIPDASSNQRRTTNSAQSDLSILRQAGITIKNQPSNPEVADRVNAVNVLLLANRLRVHPACRHLLKALEQQSYDTKGAPTKGRGGLDDISGPVDALGYGIWYLAPLRRYATGASSFTVW